MRYTRKDIKVEYSTVIATLSSICIFLLVIKVTHIWLQKCKEFNKILLFTQDRYVYFLFRQQMAVRISNFWIDVNLYLSLTLFHFSQSALLKSIKHCDNRVKRKTNQRFYQIIN